MFRMLRKTIKQLIKKRLVTDEAIEELIADRLWADRGFFRKHPFQAYRYMRRLRTSAKRGLDVQDIPVPLGMMQLRVASERSRDLIVRERASGKRKENIDGLGAERNDKLRVLLVSHEMSLTGAPLMLLTAAKVLHSRGFEVSVWTMWGSENSAIFEDEGLPVCVVQPSDLRRKTVAKIALSHDIAICNTILCDQFVSFLESRMPTLWYMHEADTIQGFLSGNDQRRETLEKSRSLVSVSEYAKETLARYTASKIRVLLNTIEDASFLLRGQSRSAHAPILVFLEMGTIYPVKGFDLLINAYLSMPDSYRQRARIQIAGPFAAGHGSYCEAIERLVTENDNIEYKGIIESDDAKAKIFDEADVFALPSRGDACALVVLEAAMFSKPMIVSDKTGANYLVDESNGIIVESDSIESLRDAMMKMIDVADSLPEMGRRSRELYEEKAGIETYATNLIGLIEERIDEFNENDET